MTLSNLQDFEILVIGSINADLVIYPQEKLTGSNYAIADDFRFNLGGKGLNQSISASMNGSSTALCGSVGDDIFGREILKRLKMLSVNTTFVTTDSSVHTGIGHVRIDQKGDYETVVFEGANMNLSNLDFNTLISDKLKAVILNYEIPNSIIEFASKYYSALGIKIFINFSPVLPNSKFNFDLADYAVLNLEEAREVLDLPDGSAENCAYKLHKLTKKAVIITEGSKGVTAVDFSSKIFKASTPKVKVENTIGAGDTYLSVLASELVKGIDFETAISNAASAAAKVCTLKESYLVNEGEW